MTLTTILQKRGSLQSSLVVLFNTALTRMTYKLLYTTPSSTSHHLLQPYSPSFSFEVEAAAVDLVDGPGVGFRNFNSASEERSSLCDTIEYYSLIIKTCNSRNKMK